MIYIFNKPLHLWLGIATFISLTLTIASGIFVGKFGIKTHKLFATITMLLALAHAIMAIIVWS